MKKAIAIVSILILIYGAADVYLYIEHLKDNIRFLYANTLYWRVVAASPNAPCRLRGGEYHETGIDVDFVKGTTKLSYKCDWVIIDQVEPKPNGLVLELK